MQVFGTPLRVLDHGQGMRVWDVDGNVDLDFLAVIAVNALGYAHPDWCEAVAQQAQRAAHVSNYFATATHTRTGARPSRNRHSAPRT